MLAPIVSVDWLVENRHCVSLCDVRYYLDGRSGIEAFQKARIPGARFIDMNRALAAPPAPIHGRHPLPTPTLFAEQLGLAGISDSDTVIAYDDVGGRFAARLVWMLRVIGQNAALLSGGLAAWPSQLETGQPTCPTPVQRSVRPWPESELVSADQLVEAIENGTSVFDSRAAERYRGEIEPLDAQAGHIPGAKNLPMDGNYDGHNFLPPDQLRARFEAAGVTEDSIFYCGSGVTACNNILAAEAAGYSRPRLYVGSWSGWSSDPTRPVATGDQP
ncbi:MAG: sulfurtransferase [Planctomycetales bacterium]|nr:sulfurtransferase [Planctomycetales bacterium]